MEFFCIQRIRSLIRFRTKYQCFPFQIFQFSNFEILFITHTWHTSSHTSEKNFNFVFTVHEYPIIRELQRSGTVVPLPFSRAKTRLEEWSLSTNRISKWSRRRIFFPSFGPFRKKLLLALVQQNQRGRKRTLSLSLSLKEESAFLSINFVPIVSLPTSAYK